MTESELKSITNAAKEAARAGVVEALADKNCGICVTGEEAEAQKKDHAMFRFWFRKPLEAVSQRLLRLFILGLVLLVASLFVDIDIKGLFK